MRCPRAPACARSGGRGHPRLESAGVAAIVASGQQSVHPGAIILFHDGGGPREQTVEALRQLLPWLQDQGYAFTLPT